MVLALEGPGAISPSWICEPFSYFSYGFVRFNSLMSQSLCELSQNSQNPARADDFEGQSSQLRWLPARLQFEHRFRQPFSWTLRISYFSFIELPESAKQIASGRSSPRTTPYVSTHFCSSHFSFQSGIPCSRNTDLNIMSTQLLSTCWKLAMSFSCRFRLWMLHHDPRPAGHSLPAFFYCK